MGHYDKPGVAEKVNAKKTTRELVKAKKKKHVEGGHEHPMLQPGSGLFQTYGKATEQRQGAAAERSNEAHH